MPGPLTTHVLDVSEGQPAEGLSGTLFQISDGDEAVKVCDWQCDNDGRVNELIRDRSRWQTGVYRIRFNTEDYFVSKGKDCFYPYCEVTFSIKDIDSHYHVPLLISPFGYSTYRGS